ncbi:MAG: type II toxin-antitoxin system MqsR family toxin [Chloroflexota bacterium]
MADKQLWQVTLFLRLFKETAANWFVFAERETTMATVAALGITLAEAKQCVLSLVESNYYRGPIPDHRGGEYWEFGVESRGREVFIKLKVDTANKVATCISFHFPDSPIVYPYRRGKEEK